jgi:hypothetical protein
MNCNIVEGEFINPTLYFQVKRLVELLTNGSFCEIVCISVLYLSSDVSTELNEKRKQSCGVLEKHMDFSFDWIVTSI